MINKKFCHTVLVPMVLDHFSPRDARLWLTETFGQEYERWALLGPAIYGFMDEKDKLLFSLRWL
jgi:hypothetical protein